MAEVEALTEFIDTAVNDIVMLVDRLLEGQEGGVSWDTADAAAEVEWWGSWGKRGTGDRGEGEEGGEGGEGFSVSALPLYPL
jgi:hypothetical protein